MSQNLVFCELFWLYGCSRGLKGSVVRFDGLPESTRVLNYPALESPSREGGGAESVAVVFSYSPCNYSCIGMFTKTLF